MKKLLVLLLVLFTLSSSYGVLVNVTWDASPDAEGYNIYKVLAQPGGTPTAVKLNQTPIVGLFYQLDVQSGDQYFVRAFNFMGESGDSNVMVVPNVPAPPGGAKLRPLAIETSTNLKDWALHTVVSVANNPRAFYRLKF